MVNKLAFINGKGGCGKTTSIINIAGVLSDRGEKVLVIDLDKQRNSTFILLSNSEMPKKTVFDFMMGAAEPHEAVSPALFKYANLAPKYYGVDVMVSDIRLEKEAELSDVNIQDKLNSFIEDQGYTWVLVDMPPSNSALNNICFSQIVEFVIVPFSSDVFSISGYGDLMDTVNNAREINENLKILGVYLSRCYKNSALDKYIINALEGQLGNMYIPSFIPHMTDIREAPLFGKPINYYKRTSPSVAAYRDLIEEIEARIELLRM